MSENMHPENSIRQLRRLCDPAEQGRLQTDAELLELYVEGGNRRAIETLVRRYSPMVATVCRMTVSDPSSAEDAFQATFLVLLKSAHKIRHRASLSAWLHGVAYRTACRARRRPRATEQLEDPSVNLQCHATSEPIVELARKMELEALDHELENLPDRLRAPLVEHYLFGFTAPQIAERMELSVSAVEGRLRRGRRLLRTQLARRGISLSVLVAGSGLFRQSLQGAEAAEWTEHFVQTQLAETDGSPGHDTLTSSTDTHISSLVQGEITMFHATTLKAAVAIGLLIIGGSFAVISIEASGSPQGGDNSGAVNLPALSASETSLAQLGFQASGGAQQSTDNGSDEPAGGAPFGAGGGYGSETAEGEASARRSNRVRRSQGGYGGEATASEAGRVTGMESQSGTVQANTVAGGQEPIEWERPEQADGELPSWLAGGQSSMQAIEAMRQVLNQKVEARFSGQPLSHVVQAVSDDIGTDFVIDTQELELLGVDPDTPVTLRASEPISLRELIRRVGDPLDLSYMVTESAIEITSKDKVQERPQMRFYDLSYVLPNSANTDALINAIQQTIEPATWLAAGGNSSITTVGSMMIVNSYDSTHQQIEVLLLKITQMNPKNVSKAIRRPAGMTGGGMIGGGMF